MTAPASPPVAGVDMETDVQFEVWQDGMMVASADSLSYAHHYMMIYGQDGPVEAVTAITTRFPGFNVLRALASPSADADTHRSAEGAVVARLRDALLAIASGTYPPPRSETADCPHGMPLTMDCMECIEAFAQAELDATAPPAASVSPGMETLQASECAKHGEGEQ